MSAATVDVSIVWPALIAGLLVTATHVPLGIQVLHRGPGDRQSVIGCSPASNLIEQDQRSGCRRMENRRGLGHLDHKRRAAARQVVTRSDAREHTVHNAQLRRSRWHK